MSNQKSRNITDISTILHKSFKKLKLGTILREHKILKVWDKAVGEKISRKAQPYKVIGSTLYVKVLNSPWMQELNFMKNIIIEKINDELKENEVEKIIFRAGIVEKRYDGSKTSKPPWLKVNLDEFDKAAIERTISSVQDQELKNTFSNLLTLEKKLKIFKNKSDKNNS